MEHYIPIRLTQAEQDISLPHQLYLEDQMEVGLIECRLPAIVGNVSTSDSIKLIIYDRPYARKYLKLTKNTPKQQGINAIFEASNYESHIHYANGRFIADINPNIAL